MGKMNSRDLLSGQMDMGDGVVRLNHKLSYDSPAPKAHPTNKDIDRF